MTRSKSRGRARPLQILGLALAAMLVFAALAAGSASALSWSKPGLTFYMSKESNLVFREGTQTMVCNGMAGTGQFASGTSGTVEMQYTKCMDDFGVSCTTAGATAGTIILNKLNFEPIYLDKAHTKYGILMKPAVAGGEIAKFKCFSNHVWKNGVIGQVESPKLNELTNFIKVGYQPAKSESSEQKWQFIEETFAKGLFNLEDTYGTPAAYVSMQGFIGWHLSVAGEFLP